MPSRVASCPFPLAARGAGETSTYGRLRQRTHCSMYIYGMVLSAGDGRTAPLGQTRWAHLRIGPDAQRVSGVRDACDGGGQVACWRAGVVDDAEKRAWLEGGGGLDGSPFVPPAPRRPRSTGHKGGVGVRVGVERMRQLGQKINGKVQPKRPTDDLARPTNALGYPTGSGGT
jgi:hypothetical protein